jgi:CRISPR-associated protein Csm4
MLHVNIYHLTPEGPFHVGQRGVGLEETGVHLPSDTLFAAMVAAYAEAGFPPADLTQPFETAPARGKPPFLLTSALPRAGQVRFYPTLPLSWLNLSGPVRDSRLKELKRIQFVSETIFEKMVNGEALDDYLPPADEAAIHDKDRGIYLQGRSLWLTAPEADKLPEQMRRSPSTRPSAPRPLLKGKQLYQALRHQAVWQTGKTPRVTVDRLRNASNIFHIGRLVFSPDCGWWFGLSWQMDDPPLQQAVKRALELLSDTGLGGERAAGYGRFTYQQAEVMTWNRPAAGDYFVTLSRFHPRPEELPAMLQGAETAYKLVTVAGWLNSNQADGQSKAQRRRRLWLLAEGSIVAATGNGPWGDLTDVRPKYESSGTQFTHAIWRYGFAFPVALKGVKAP